MKKFNYLELKRLHLMVGSEDWANSRMCGRCGISTKRAKKIKELSPSMPYEYILEPAKYNKLAKLKQEDAKNDVQ